MSLVFYKKSDGTKPAGEFIKTLATDMKAKVVRDIDLLEKYGFDLGKPYVKKMQGKKYDKLYKAIEKQKGIIAKLKLEELDLTAEREKLRRFMKTIEKHEVTDNFQANIWNNTIEKATVNIDKTITFMFKNSVEINIKL